MSDLPANLVPSMIFHLPLNEMLMQSATGVRGAQRVDGRRLVALDIVSVLVAVLCVTGGCRTDTNASDAGTPTVSPLFRSAKLDAVLEGAASRLLTRGLVSHVSVQRGFLAEGGTHVQEVLMRTSQCYVVLNAGSAELNELRCRVYDNEGGVLAERSEAGGIVALQFCPSETGTYYIVLEAIVGGGLVASQVFRGPTGLDVYLEDLVDAQPDNDG